MYVTDACDALSRERPSRESALQGHETAIGRLVDSITAPDIRTACETYVNGISRQCAAEAECTRTRVNVWNLATETFLDRLVQHATHVHERRQNIDRIRSEFKSMTQRAAEEPSNVAFANEVLSIIEDEYESHVSALEQLSKQEHDRVRDDILHTCAENCPAAAAYPANAQSLLQLRRAHMFTQMGTLLTGLMDLCATYATHARWLNDLALMYTVKESVDARLSHTSRVLEV